MILRRVNIRRVNKMPQKNRVMKPTAPPYGIIGIIIGLIVVSATIPINKNIDIVTDVSINYPLIWSDPKITDVNTKITAHTWYHLPALSTAGIVSEPDVKIKVLGSGKSATKSIGTLYRTEELTYTITLADVRPTTNTITVELYSGSTKLDSKEVKLS